MGFFNTLGRNLIKEIDKSLKPPKQPVKKKPPAKSSIEPVRSFTMNISGESFDNEDGTNRQQILKRCRVGEPVKLILSPVSEDINAVKVCRLDGVQIGWIPKWASAEFAAVIRQNVTQDVEIAEIKRGDYIGCRLKISRYTDDLTWNEKNKLRT